MTEYKTGLVPHYQPYYIRKINTRTFMKTTISALPPPVVIPPRDVTIVVTEQEARDIKLFLGRQAFRDYDKAFKEAATEGTNIVRVVKSPEAMQSTCDALWRALNNVV